MKNFIFIFKSALDDFGRNKMRTFLTSLGILIGVFAVVVLIALGLGLKKYIANQFEAMGNNTIFLVPGRILSNGGFRGSPSALTGRFDSRDLDRLKKIKNVTGIAPISLKSTKIKGPLKEDYADIMFSSELLFNMMGFEAEAGRLFNKADVTKRSKVVVAGSKIATDFYGSADEAVGKKIIIGNVKFTIVGAIKNKGGEYDSYLFGPYTTGYIFNPDKKFFRLAAKIVNEDAVPQAKEDIKREFLRRYDEEEFSVVEPTELLSAIDSIFSVLNLVLVAIAAISLVVGGIGIMNIMYVTVSDRIKEIGIRRAIGARRSDILYQFLAEAMLLSSIGGVLGLALAYLAVFLVSSLFPAYIDLMSVALALGISSAIGITFGVFPARKAANLEPVEAIRYE